MSLDVYLRLPGAEFPVHKQGIFVRQNGQTLEISREQWDSEHPGVEPVMFERKAKTDLVYSDNITHNLNRMAMEVGIYECLWRPEQVGITKARQLIEPLSIGLSWLKREPVRFRAFNPGNGWGSYEGFVDWIEEYLAACCRWPESEVSVWR